MAGTKVLVSFEVDNAGAVTKVRQFKGELEAVPRSADAASSGLTKLKNALAAVGAIFATVKIGQFFRESIQAAKEEQETFVRLAATLASLGVEYNKVAVEMQGMFERIQATTRFSDDEAAGAFQRLLIVTGDYGAAVKLLGPVLDMAVGGTMDLQTAATLAGKATTGFTGILERQIGKLSDATKEQLKHASAAERTEIIVGALNARFGGQAQANLKSFGAQMEQLANYWDDLQEAVGATIISLAQWGGKLMSLKDVMAWWKEAILDFGQLMVTAFNTDYSAFFRFMLLKIQQQFQTFVAEINIAMQDLPDWLGGGDAAAQRAYRAVEKIIAIQGEMGKIATTAFADAVRAGEEWRRMVENLMISTGNLAGAIAGDGGGGGQSLTDALGKLESAAYTALTSARNDLLNYNESVIDGIFEQWRERYGNEMPQILIEPYEYIPPAAREAASASNTILVDSFSDLLGKGFMGELESFSDLWDEIWQDLAKSMVGIIGDAFADAVKNGWGRLQGLFDELKGNLGALIGGVGMVYGGYQQGGTGGIIQGILGGAMAGAFFGPLGAAIGAVIGGVAAWLGNAAEDPESLVRNLGLDSGELLTRGHQGYSQELQDLWIRQQQQIMRSYISSYRAVLRLFEDQSLFDLIGATPTFDTAGWMGMGADQLATYLQEEFWPTAFMNMFREAISAGLEGFGVTNATIDQLWSELEDLPGADRMGALTTYVSSLVDLSRLMEDMDWNAIMDVVGMDSMQAFMFGIGEITGSIETLMTAMSDMTLLERAEQAQQIEQLIVQVRQAEIQYLMQLDQLQRGINQSIEAMLEQFQIGDMGPGAQQTYYQQRIAEIMAVLAGGGVTSPEQLQQLMADLQRYISALAQGLGDQLYQPMDIMGWGQTWADYLSGILLQAQGYSDAYFEEFRNEVRQANDDLIEALRDLIDALTDFQGGINGEGAGNYGQGTANPFSPESAMYGGGATQVNVYLEGSMSALRPFVRAEIRDSMRGRPRGIN